MMEAMDTQAPTDWQQAHNLMLRLLEGQQARLEEMVRMRTQEAEGRIQLFACQQDLCKKIEAQQMLMVQEGGGSGLPRMMAKGDVEAYLESFEKAATATKWDPGSWAARLGPLLIGPA